MKKADGELFRECLGTINLREPEDLRSSVGASLPDWYQLVKMCIRLENKKDKELAISMLWIEKKTFH